MVILVIFDDIWNEVSSKMWKMMVMTALMGFIYTSSFFYAFQRQMCSAKNAGSDWCSFLFFNWYSLSI